MWYESIWYEITFWLFWFIGIIICIVGSAVSIPLWLDIFGLIMSIFGLVMAIVRLVMVIKER